MSDLSDLIARVEAATGGDRRLDLAIAEALKQPFRYTDCPGGPVEINCARYTSSLDDALALAERKFSGGLGWWVEMETAGMGATLRGPDGEQFSGGGVGKDLPTAVLAALLRALQAQGGAA